MIYSGDEIYGDEITSGLDDQQSRTVKRLAEELLEEVLRKLNEGESEDDASR